MASDTLERLLTVICNYCSLMLQLKSILGARSQKPQESIQQKSSPVQVTVLLTNLLQPWVTGYKTLSHKRSLWSCTWQFTVPPRLSAAGGCSSSQVPPLSKVMTDRMLSSLTEPLMSVAMKTPRSPSTRWRSAKGSLAKYLKRRGDVSTAEWRRDT